MDRALISEVLLSENSAFSDTSSSRCDMVIAHEEGFSGSKDIYSNLTSISFIHPKACRDAVRPNFLRR
jgi:hypothetical protein